MKRRASLVASAIAVLCGCLPADNRPEPASLRVHASPSDATLAGFSSQDGWEVRFERFVCALGDVRLESPRGQEVDVCCLSRDERGLTLREDQDPRGEVDPLGDGGQVGEHHERVVERVVLRVRARQWRRSLGVHGTEHVVIGEQVVEAEALDRCADLTNGVGVSSKLGLWVHDADVHGPQLPMSQRTTSSRSR